MATDTLEAARNRLILAPLPEKDDAWADLYLAVVGPPPGQSSARHSAGVGSGRGLTSSSTAPPQAESASKPSHTPASRVTCRLEPSQLRLLRPMPRRWSRSAFRG